LQKNGVQIFLSFFLDKNSCSPKKLRRFWKKQLCYHFMLLQNFQKTEKIEKIEKNEKIFFKTPPYQILVTFFSKSRVFEKKNFEKIFVVFEKCKKLFSSRFFIFFLINPELINNK
jgi:hypothetical protein